MSKLIEVKGVQYTESELERAIAIEKFVYSQKFKDLLYGNYDEEDLKILEAGGF